MNGSFSKEDLANLRVTVQTSKSGFSKKYLEELQRKIMVAEANPGNTCACALLEMFDRMTLAQSHPKASIQWVDESLRDAHRIKECFGLDVKPYLEELKKAVDLKAYMQAVGKASYIKNKLWLICGT